MYMVASWACEVTEILKQRSTEEDSFVWGLKSPHKPKIPDIHIAVSVDHDTF